jgi:nucleoside 2-deoxyribosyltransferase
MSDPEQKCMFCQQGCKITRELTTSFESSNGGEPIYIPILESFNCHSCGLILIGHVAKIEVNALPENIKQLIQIYLHNDAIRDPDGRTLITEDSLHLGFSWQITISELAQKVRRYTVTERLNRALLNVARLSPQVGFNLIETTVRSPHGGLIQKNIILENPSTLFAENSNVAGWMLKTLVSQGYIESGNGFCILTAAGWARVEELTVRAVDSQQGFVAMWFDNAMDEIYDKGIAPAISLAGYAPYRVKGKPTDQKVDDEIMAQIRRSRFVVADFTGHRPAVYFEAGFALGRGIHVIWTCREDEVEKLSFDTRQYGHICWNNPEKLKRDLAYHIESRLGRGQGV